MQRRYKSSLMQNITDVLSKFFTNVGHSLSKTIPKSKSQFQISFNNSSLSSFALKPVTIGKVRKPISQLKNRKALGSTSILFIIFQDSSDVLARTLTLILNQVFEQGVFAEILKIA